MVTKLEAGKLGFESLQEQEVFVLQGDPVTCPSNSALVLQYGSGQSSDFAAKIHIRC
jgi:hypothetical protein